MLPLIDAALKQQRYPLVLWQTGTVEAVRGLQPDGMLDVLHAGAERVRDAGGDLVLIDPQFSRFLRANTDLDPYENVMQQVATMPGVALFHRFDLMRAWANDGRIDLERTPKADRDKALEELNVCLGKALARFVLSGGGRGEEVTVGDRLRARTITSRERPSPPSSLSAIAAETEKSHIHVPPPAQG